MNVNERERRIITILTVFTIVFTFFGASLAYWNWETNDAQRTDVAFTVTQDFTCSVDGGGNITQTDAFIAPSTCLNSDGAVSEHVIMREVTVSTNIIKSSLDIHMNLWIELINNNPNTVEFGQGLSDSENFRYVLTTSNTSCDSNIVSKGTFNGKSDGDTITILDKSFSSTTTETYYLWIWLDWPETSSTTMNQQFNLRLNGNCDNIREPSNEEILNDLQNQYDFKYYSTLNLAVTDVNNGTIGQQTDANRENAVAGVYTDENGGANVVLLQDTTEATRVKPTVNMTINLGGHTLSADDAIGIDIISGNVTIDGSMNGSTILMERTTSTYAVQIRDASVTIDGGSYMAYTNYLQNGTGDYVSQSAGINNYAGQRVILNNCYVKGTHSGLKINGGIVYINGGTYESYGHGGIYFTSGTSYARNATIRECAMPEGYTTDIYSNNSGFYIGGYEEANNISVYMDNCNIYGSNRAGVLRGTSGEQNNTIYISNSTINDGATFRIDNDTHKLYIGSGNNFTAEDTNRASSVIVTDEVYIFE